MWAMPKVEVRPVAVGALGAIPNGLNKSLQNIGISVRSGHVQKTALLELKGYCEEFLRFERCPEPCEP